MNTTLRASRASQRLGVATINLLVAAWLMMVQPGMSHYWLIAPHVHAAIDAEAYGQSPLGETLPGHPSQAPHQHPIGLGMATAQPTMLNPLDLTVRALVTLAARRPALLNRWIETSDTVPSIVIEPPLQPPRVAL